MEDRTCPKCKCIFKFPSLLLLHMKTTYHCFSNNEEIEMYIKHININKINQCDYCEKKFTRHTDLNRHKIKSKCGKLQDAKNIEQKYGVNKLTLEQLKLLYPDNYKNMLSNIQTQIINNNNNTIINNNITNNTINNNINNNIIIQHINPFGFEDVRTIPISEMKMILNSGSEAGLHIIKTIYNKIENKNFYKPNIARQEVAFLNNNFNLTIYKSKEFCDALFDRCIALLHHMLFLCKNEYTSINIKCIYNNIEYIETTMRTEIYEKKLQNIIETEFRNNNIDTKDRIKKFIKKIKEDTEIKDNSLLQIKNTLELKTETNIELQKTIKNKEINKLFGNPKVILGLRKEEILLNLRITRFEESIFYNFWKERIKNIKNYIMTHKKSTIGDIINLTKEENKINGMLDIIKQRVDNYRGNEDIDLNINEEFNLNDFEREEEENTINTIINNTDLTDLDN